MIAAGYRISRKGTTDGRRPLSKHRQGPTREPTSHIRKRGEKAGWPARIGARLHWLGWVPLFGAISQWIPFPPLAYPWHLWSSLWGYLAWPSAVLLPVAIFFARRGLSREQVDPVFVLGLELLAFGVLTALSLWQPAQETVPGAGGQVGDLLARWLVAGIGLPLASLVVGLGVGTGLVLLYQYRPWTLDHDILWWWWLWLRARLGPWLGWHLPTVPRVQATSWRGRFVAWIFAHLPRWPFRRSGEEEEVAFPERPFPSHVEAGYALPPLSLLEQEDIHPLDKQELQRQARLIRETLASFGIPVRVVEVHRGPAVTQFCVQPLTVKRGGKKRRISVRRILAVQNDLALMLAAAPIRIEAPVPGKPYVGIEVPNATISVVRLGSVMASDAFQRLRGPLALALGRDVMGTPVVSDLVKLPHLLIAGATGAGKSVAINSMIITWLMRNTPQELRLLLIDPKRVELTAYAGVPHLVGPVVTDIDDVLRALTWVMMEMDDRYRRFAKARARSLARYNAWALRHHEPPLPYLVVIIDELADIMLAHGNDVEYALARLAQMARATGIHLVVATQRPSVDVITGLIKANFPARLAFAVTSQVDSRVILDTPGAETLLGRGDALFLPPDRPSPIRLQGSYVSDEEIARVVHWWRDHAETPPPAQGPWSHLNVDAMDKDKEEALLERAIALARQEERVSASFFQRKLRIGFKRAQELIEQLEAMGVVGPDEGGGRGRRVLLHEETLMSEREAGVNGSVP